MIEKPSSVTIEAIAPRFNLIDRMMAGKSRVSEKTHAAGDPRAGFIPPGACVCTVRSTLPLAVVAGFGVKLQVPENDGKTLQLSVTEPLYVDPTGRMLKL